MDLSHWYQRAKYNKSNPLPEGYNHEWGANYSSNWDYCVTMSNYHFDKFQEEKEGDYWTRLGCFVGEWNDIAEKINEKSKELNWQDLTAKGLRGFPGVTTPMAKQEKADRLAKNLEENYANVVLPEDLVEYDVIQKMINFWHLENCKPRVQVSMPGDFFALHIDKLWHNCPTDPTRTLRIHVMLQDWEPGQMIEYGNMVYTGWHAGEVHAFDHFNTPHATANLSSKPRPMLSIIGQRTDRTDEVLAMCSPEARFTI